uniref:Uncharacterized protein n=1 Tax=Anguilla anguilla TaxID=7936 RepID=A0A0E9X8I2_ANGAN
MTREAKQVNAYAKPFKVCPGVGRHSSNRSDPTSQPSTSQSSYWFNKTVHLFLQNSKRLTPPPTYRHTHTHKKPKTIHNYKK